jgi:hypothetical protein
LFERCSALTGQQAHHDEQQLGGEDLVADGLLGPGAVRVDLAPRLGAQPVERPLLPRPDLGEFGNSSATVASPASSPTRWLLAELKRERCRQQRRCVVQPAQGHGDRDRADPGLEGPAPGDADPGRVLGQPGVEL